jgi:hypothetical protein
LCFSSEVRLDYVECSVSLRTDVRVDDVQRSVISRTDVRVEDVQRSVRSRTDVRVEDVQRSVRSRTDVSCDNGLTCRSDRIHMSRSVLILITAARECVTGVALNAADDRIQFPSFFAVLF